MGRAKEIIIKVIPASVANPFVKKHHYSGKVVQNSNLHFGAFLDNKLHGVLSFGPSMFKKELQGLVEGTGWNDFIELNRMAFDDYLPRNSESYCISKAIMLIKKNAPHVKWVVSFADGCQCGDGTIYRASNFVLTGITKNKTILEFPSGLRIANITLTGHFELDIVKKQCEYFGVPHKYRTVKEWLDIGKGTIKPVDGYMLRYIYFIDKSCKDRLTVPIIPFSKIDEIGAGMYKGEKITLAERHGGK